MSPHITAVVGLKTVSLVLGGLITYFAYKAYSRTGARPLRALAVGFGIVTLGALLAGIVDIFPQLGARDFALLIDTTLTTVGFGVILYSLYAE